MHAPAPEGELGRRVMRKVAWRLIPMLGLMYFFAFLDRVNVGYAALTMNADLGLSAAAFGIGSGIFFVGYVLCEVPSNVLLERFGARIWLARIMITWGLLSGAMAFVQGPTGFYVVRFLLGVAEAGFFPGVIYYLTCWFPGRHRARVMALFLIALPFSSVIGAPVSTSLLGIEAWGLHGWQWMFLLEALPTVLIGIAVLFVLTNRPEQAKWLSGEEKAWLTGELRAEAGKDHGRSHGASLKRALTLPHVWLFGLVYFGILVGLYGFSFWFPQIVASLGHLSNLQVGLATMVPYIAVCIVMVWWGRHSDATGERAWHVAAPPLVGAMALCASVWLGEPVWVFAALSIAAVGIYSGLPAFWALASTGLSGVAAAGAIALINSLGNLGGFIGPAVIGFVKERTGSYGASMLLPAACLVLTGVMVFVARRSAQRAMGKEGGR